MKQEPKLEMLESMLEELNSTLRPGATTISLEKKTSTGGLKFDSSKVPLDLIPSEALFEIGKVLAFGAQKYGRSNWAQGIEMSRLIAASLRHIAQFNQGEDLDEEAKTLHLANAATNLMFAIWMFRNRPDLDDRWTKAVPTKA